MAATKIVLTTAGSKEEARRIAHELVERRVAACVNIAGPIESVYRWKEKVENADEWLLIVKTTAAMCSAACETIREIHSYELPECIEIDIERGSEAYLQWIAENVRPSQG